MLTMKISLVLPATNEARSLLKNVKKIEAMMRKLRCGYEIIIAEDGSTDGTDKIAASLASRNKTIVHLHSDKRKGKGKAIKDAFKVANGDTLSFMDADLSADINYFPKLIEAIKNGADIAIGSRHLPESKVQRSFKRAFLSRGFNLLVQLMFNPGIKDLQCGFKGFRKKTLPVLLSAKNNGFLWDTEVLLLAKKKRFKIVEVPIMWKEGKKSSLNLLKIPAKMFYSLIKLKMRVTPK